MPVVKNITFRRGEAIVLPDTIAGENVTGWTFQFTIRRGYVDQDGNLIRPAGNPPGWAATGEDPDVLVRKDSGDGIETTDAAGGEIEITLSADDTLALPVGDCAYDVWRVDAGAEACLTIGNLRVGPAVRG